MKIVELNAALFDNYSKNHILGSFFQTSSYALLMAEQGYSYDFIAYIDKSNNILAASLILYKKISLFIGYGYAPKGFLIDYMNKNLLANFTNDLKTYYNKKKLAFIKINPEIAIGEIDKTNFKVHYNQNKIISNNLTELGYFPLIKDKNFKNKLPTYNAILPLKKFDLTSISKPTRTNIKNSIKKGLIFEVTKDPNTLNILYNFIKKKKNIDLNFYKDLYNVYSKNNMIDIILIKTDYKTFLENIKSTYEQELENNILLSELIKENSKETYLNRKMESDRTLSSYKEDLEDATKGTRKKDIYIAGAIIIKYQNRVSIFISGYDKFYDKLNPNYFLHYKIAEYYKNNFDFIDLNGISGNFDSQSKYYGLNKFKIGFNPKIYEFIGEYDLIINSFKYKNFISSPKLFKKYSQKK